MKEPTLKFQTFIFEGENSGLHDLCTLQLQYFTPEQTYDLFEHEYVKRYDTHFYRKIGEKNCREDAHKVLFSTEKGNMGYIFSMAKSIAENGNYGPNDHLVVTFSGYGDCTGCTFILDFSAYAKPETKVPPVIDDYELLMKKFNALSE